MFIEEPEGHSFEELLEYLGAAAAVGMGIELDLSDGTKAKGFLDYSQELTPEKIRLFNVKENDTRDRTYSEVKTAEITHFKLLRHGVTDSYIDEDGVPTAKPLIMIMAKELRGNGKIINNGTTSIYAVTVDFDGEITTEE